MERVGSSGVACHPQSAWKPQIKRAKEPRIEERPAVNVGLNRLLAAPLGDEALTSRRWLPAREDDRNGNTEGNMQA